MRAKILGLATVGAVAAATLTVAVAPAGASFGYWYYGYAGGSSIKAFDNTVVSRLSAESTAYDYKAGTADTNTVADVKAQGVLVTGEISTSAQVKAITGGLEVVVTARAANVNVLGGLITAKAITTTTVEKRVNGVISATNHSDFLDLKIAGNTLPTTIPQNYGVRLGDLATVAVNAGGVATTPNYTAAAGAGLYITLLKPSGTVDKGAEIDLTPTYTMVFADDNPATGHTTTGGAYATKISAAAGTAVGVRSDPTVPTQIFAQGTKGQLWTNNSVGLNLGTVGKIGAIKTTGTAINTKTVATITTTASVADVNLLGGIITATAVKVTAHSELGHVPTATMTLADLKIGSTKIPLSVRPNTVINLGIGKVTINQQLRNGSYVMVRGVDIVLGKPTGGLPAGAEIQLAVAYARAN
jgi:hypothetical protein